MFGSSILVDTFTRVINTRFVNGVYHSVIMKELTNGDVRPVAPIKGRFVPVGVEDHQGFSSYCRQIAPAEVLKVVPISSTSKQYQFRILHRLVFFNPQEKRSQEQVTSQLVKAVIGSPHVEINKIRTDHMELLKSEQPGGRFTFRDNTYYTAIDFYIFLRLQANNCEEEISCEGILNPYRVTV